MSEAYDRSVPREVLIEQARAARDNMAFVYDSNYYVGAAVETDQGIFQGGNIEVSGRTTSVHAEMMAVFSAVKNGATEFDAIAIAPDQESGVFPCGLCLHTMAQFTYDMEVIEPHDGEVISHDLTDLIHDETYRPRKKLLDTRGIE